MSNLKLDEFHIEGIGAIPSAATVDLENATGDLIDISGTTAITRILLYSGHERTVRFTGALVLTEGSTLILPNNGSNITTAAGDFAVFRGYASGIVRCVGYTRKGGLLPPKVYVALLTQTGTAAPVATVQANTLGGTVVWSRSGTGIYAATLAGAFTNASVLLGSLYGRNDGNNVFSAWAQPVSADAISLSTSLLHLDDLVTGTAPMDDLLLTTPIRIEVYP